MRLITRFDPWQSQFCTCPPKFSLSAYTGCSHGCLYCYASSYIRNFACVRPKKDFLKTLTKEIKNIPENAIITIANSSDPYLPQEQKLQLTRAALEILKNYPVKIIIVTKSSLILRDLDILKETKKAVVCFTLTTLNKSLANKLEPGAPPPQERLKAIATLSQHLPVAARFDPLIYNLNTGEIESMVKELKMRGVTQVITSTYKAKGDNFRRMTGAFPEHKNIWHKLYMREGEKIGPYIYLPREVRKGLIEKVRETCLKQNLDFSSCREGFGGLNTKACDGSSLNLRIKF